MSGTSYHHERIIVVGAGMSGLACARELQHRGYAVLVVEARSRVGGRLKGAGLSLSSEDKEVEIDLGGALIHGVEDNPLTSIVQDLGLAVQQVQECLLFQNGWPIDPKDDARIASVFNDCLEESFQRCKGEDNGTSFGELFQEVCAERSVNSSAIFNWHKANLEVSCGASFHELGWKWNEDEPYGYDGDHVALQQSWKAVVDCLAEGLDILYDTPVKRIHIVRPVMTDPLPTSSTPIIKPSSEKISVPKQRESWSLTPSRKSRRLMHVDASARRSLRANLGQAVNRYTVEHPPPQTPKRRKSQEETARPKKTIIQVHLQNGTVLEASHVVCTLPLAILKSNTSMFDPPLPSPKLQAIQRLGAGLLNKCALSFSHTFWQESDFMGLAAEETSYLILNAHAYTGKPVLAFLFGGSLAKDIEEWTDKEIVADCVRVLKKICGRQIPEPIDYRVTRWGHEQFSRMAFTYIPSGVDGFNELRIISEPVFDHTGTKLSLMFAGEHTTPFHPSTIHGAFLSGIREAYRLDLALYPQANEDLTFSDSELYQRTFTVKRRYFGENSVPLQVRSNPDPSAQPASRRQHRQRGAAGVMKLRKRPDASRSTSAPSQSSTGLNALPARKSPRAVMRPQIANFAEVPENGGTGQESTHWNPQKPSRDLTILEDATLVRGMESYGNDYEYLLEKIVPVHGSGDVMTLPQLRKRCQQLLSVIRKGRASSTSSWRRWVPKTVYPSDTASPDEMDETVDSERQPSSSQREDDKVPVASVKTRAGRLVKKPGSMKFASFA